MSPTQQTGIWQPQRRHNSDYHQYQRWGALVSGGALAVFGLTRRSITGTALAAAGGALAYAGYKSGSNGTSNHPEITGSLLLNCSPQDAYRFYRDFSNVPLFSRRIESVTMNGNRSRWVAIAPFGKRLHWDAELTNEHEGRSIAWRSLPGSDLNVKGTVEFLDAPGDRGTMLRWHMEYSAPSGTPLRALSGFLGRQAAFFARQDMRRLKTLIETGEIPTTHGQSHGLRSAVAAAVRVIDPTRPIRPESKIMQIMQAERRAS